MSRASWRYEIPLLYLLLAGLEASLRPSGVFFETLSPHPYWLGVLLFSGRYGLHAGLFSGGLSAALLTASVWLFGDRYRLEDADFYFQPFLFVAVGAALGGAVERLSRRAETLSGLLAQAQDSLKALADEGRILLKANRAVEQQVVSQMSSLVTLYQGSRELGHLDREQLFHGILDFFSEALSASKAALYRREGDRWVLYGQKGWQPGDDFPSSLDFGQGLVGRAGPQDRVVSLRDWFAGDVEKAWEGRAKADAIMAGPIHREDGEVIGVFAAQELPFLRFNSAALNLLTLLLDWADEAVAKALYFEELRSQSILDEVLGVYNETYFSARCEQEFARSKTYALPFSVMLVSPRGLAQAPAPAQAAYLKALGRLLTASCRRIDVVAKFPDPEIPFAVLLMTAAPDQARELKAKVAEAAKRLALGRTPDGDSPVQLALGVGAYAAAMDKPEDLIAAARKDLG